MLAAIRTLTLSLPPHASPVQAAHDTMMMAQAIKEKAMHDTQLLQQQMAESKAAKEAAAAAAKPATP